MEIVLIFLSLLNYSEKEYIACKDNNIETLCVIQKSELDFLDKIEELYFTL